MTPKLELRSLCKEYDDGAVVAVDGIDLSMGAGETIALLGPSGCGKSTTLNMIVGLEQPSAGDILIDGRSVAHVPPGRRNVGLVFQDYAVFTSMSVRKNLAFGLEVRRKSRKEIERAVSETAELLGMADMLDARAKDLGGSELQRVAIGRTLITKPSILLLDEPLSNLETAARLAMRQELRRLQSEIGLTIIYVTHDQVEALSLADRIAVMHSGKIRQVEKTELICEKPGHVYVAEFLGSPPMNLIRGRMDGRGGCLGFLSDDFWLPLVGPKQKDCALPEGEVTLGIKPDCLLLAPSDRAPLAGEVKLVELRGEDCVLTVEIGSQLLKLVVPATESIQVGETVGMVADLDGLAFFDCESECRTDISFQGSVQ